MAAPQFRAVDQHTAEVVPPPAGLVEQYCRTIALTCGLSDTQIDDIQTELAEELADVREIDAMREELAMLRSINWSLRGQNQAVEVVYEELDVARKEVDDLTDLLKASGTHVANLSTTLAAYQCERDEYQEQRDEYRDRFDLACEERDEARARVDELSAEVDRLGEAVIVARSDRDAARYERDTANARASL